MISESSVNAFIRVWRIARMSSAGGHLGFPKVNILHVKHGLGEDETEDSTDAELVQSIVEQMPAEIRSAFEAYHLGIIRGENCRDKPHKWRWLVLGIDEKRYKAREYAGRNLIRNHLLTYSEKAG